MLAQSYDFIFISARDFWEKLLKKLENTKKKGASGLDAP